jgi:predicted secreted protein
MTLGLGVPLFLTVWWVVFLSILPLGVVSHAEAGVDRGDGGDPGAPLDPKLGRKAFTTTWVSLILFAIIWLVLAMHWIPIPRFASPV